MGAVVTMTIFGACYDSHWKQYPGAVIAILCPSTSGRNKGTMGNTGNAGNAGNMGSTASSGGLLKASKAEQVVHLGYSQGMLFLSYSPLHLSPVFSPPHFLPLLLPSSHFTLSLPRFPIHPSHFSFLFCFASIPTLH